GGLTATFSETPQQPFSHLHLIIEGGPRAPLINPDRCGTQTAEVTLVPWSHEGAEGEEGTPIAHLQSSFTIDQNCATGFNPKLSGGARNPLAGATSPFGLRLTREDQDQQLSGLTATLPPGLSGYLKGIPYCPDSVLASLPKEADG